MVYSFMASGHLVGTWFVILELLIKHYDAIILQLSRKFTFLAMNDVTMYVEGL